MFEKELKAFEALLETVDGGIDISISVSRHRESSIRFNVSPKGMPRDLDRYELSSHGSVYKWHLEGYGDGVEWATCFHDDTLAELDGFPDEFQAKLKSVTELQELLK